MALNETQRIKEVVADETDRMNGSLRIGVLPTVAPYLVPDFIYHFRKAYPHVSLFIDEREKEALLQGLKYGNLDMVLSTSPEEADARILEIPVYTEKFVAYLSEQCDQAKDCLANGTLPPEQMWILKEGHCMPHSGMNFCQNKDIGNHIYEAGSIETLIKSWTATEDTPSFPSSTSNRLQRNSGAIFCRFSSIHPPNAAFPS